MVRSDLIRCALRSPFLTALMIGTVPALASSALAAPAVASAPPGPVGAPASMAPAAAPAPGAASALGSSVAHASIAPVMGEVLTARCARLAQQAKQRIDSVRGVDMFDAARETLAIFGRCWPAGRGAWALSLDKIQIEGTVAFTGRWSVVYLNPDGAASAAAPALPVPDQRDDLAGDAPNLDFTVGNHVHLREPTLFDYDGDGVAELILPLGSTLLESGSWERGRVWTARSGKVAIYGPARELVVRDVRDVDRDGRPDLLIRDPYAMATEFPYSGFSMELTGPELVAHALPGGGFAQGDAVAETVARAACPRRPGKLVVRAPEEREIESERTAVNVVCARLFGVPAAQVRAELLRTCKYDEKAEPGSFNCHFQEIFLKWAAVPPPLVLTAARPAGAP